MIFKLFLYIYKEWQSLIYATTQYCHNDVAPCGVFCSWSSCFTFGAFGFPSGGVTGLSSGSVGGTVWVD